MPIVRITVEAYNKLNRLAKNQDLSKVVSKLITDAPEKDEDLPLIKEALKKFFQSSGMLNNQTNINRFQDAIDVLNKTKEETQKTKPHKEELTCYKCKKKKTCAGAWDELNIKPFCAMA